MIVCCVYIANLTSLSLEDTTSHILATYRPTSRWPNVRHQVWPTFYILLFLLFLMVALHCIEILNHKTNLQKFLRIFLKITKVTLRFPKFFLVEFKFIDESCLNTS